MSRPLEPTVTYPVGLGNDSPVRQPPPRPEGEGQLPRPDTTRDETVANDTLDLQVVEEEEGDYRLENYDYPRYEYEEYTGEYEYYDYDNSRRKRHPKKRTNEVEGTQEPPSGQGSSDREDEATQLYQSSEGLDKDATRNANHVKSKKQPRKRRKNEPQSNFRDREEEGTASQVTQSLLSTDHHQQQQQEEAQRGSRRRGKHSRRIENLHPLKAFGLRSKREGASSWSGWQSSSEDVTWI